MMLPPFCTADSPMQLLPVCPVESTTAPPPVIVMLELVEKASQTVGSRTTKA
jgi:hypothetical protein